MVNRSPLSERLDRFGNQACLRVLGLRILNHPLESGFAAAAPGRARDVPFWRVPVRDPETIENELMEISLTADDSIRFERIVAWCVAHPDEVPFALHQLLRRRDKHPPVDSSKASS